MAGLLEEGDKLGISNLRKKMEHVICGDLPSTEATDQPGVCPGGATRSCKQSV